MSNLPAPETFEFFARYLLAGFVFLTLRSWQVAAKRPRLKEQIAEAVILSLINQVILLMTFFWADDVWHAANAPASLLLQYVVQPALLGVAVGWLIANDQLPSGLRRLFMPGVQPISEAYGCALQQNPGETSVIVSYEDGRDVFGFFGEESLASEDGQSGGLYLERLYGIGEDGIWVDASPPRADWLSPSGVRSIQFLAERSDDAQNAV